MTKKEIEVLEQKLINAMKLNDTKQMNEMIHEKILFRIPSGDLVGKEDHISQLESGDVQIKSIETSNYQINIIDDNAVVSVHKKLVGTFQNNPFEGMFHYIRF